MSSTDTVANSPIQIINSAAKPPSLDDLMTVYNNNFYSNLFFLVILTIVFIIILFNVFAGGFLANIVNNWPKYRCNPMVMPFAGLFGYDATENFDFCMKNIFQSNAATVLGPVYGLMSSFTDIAGTISNSANSFRYLIANLLNGMERLMSSYRDRFQGLLFAIRMSYIKMFNLMGRLYGTFYAIIFIGLSGLKAADNIANNDLVSFLLEFCFDPNTPIIMADGTIKPLNTIQIGDKLKSINGTNPTVISLFKFNGSNTPMVKIGDTLVSKEHFVQYNGNWRKSCEHPSAIEAESIPELICLNTDIHILEINGTIFSDYDESNNSHVISSTQNLAEKLLNSGLYDIGNELTSNYDLGLDPNMPVILENGVSKKISEIIIGDKLLGGNIVLGLVKESCERIVNMPNGFMVSTSQLVWDTTANLWRRAAFVYPTKCEKLEEPVILHHLVTSNNIIESTEFLFRDYREVNEPDMEKAYENNLTKL